MKRVVITGAASGIGAEAMRQMKARNARVIGLDLVADDGIIACDVRDQASVDSAVARAIAELGGLDVLVNNAGIAPIQSAAAAPGADAQAVLDVNLLGPWRVTAAAIDALRASRGRVVNVASGLAFVNVAYAPAYCMSKRGLVGYSDTLRYEVGHEVEVTTLYPGYVVTPIHDSSRNAGFALEGMVPEEPLEAVAARLTAAALGGYMRDRATTPAGTVAYAFARHAPRRLMDAIVRSAMRRQAKAGRIDENGIAGDLSRSLRQR